MSTRILRLVAVSAFLSVTSVTAVFADADDVKWVKQCISDNKDEGQTSKTVEVYCTCMNDKMPSSESRSITQWEKTHKAEENACGKKAGWAGK